MEGTLQAPRTLEKKVSDKENMVNDCTVSHQRLRPAVAGLRADAVEANGFGLDRRASLDDELLQMNIR